LCAICGREHDSAAAADGCTQASPAAPEWSKGKTMTAVLTERHGAVALLTLNRPAVRNAIDFGLARDVCAAVEAAQDANCIVLTGADPAFCAGLDLRNLGTDQLMDLPRFNDAVRRSTVPVIAAVNGAAITGGFEMALACDFIVASEKAFFGDTHLRVGVYPGPVAVDLPRRVGIAKAREMCLTGNFVDAATAKQIGLANHVVPHDELIPFALSLAQAIAEQDRAMVRTLRRDWTATASLPEEEAMKAHYAFAAEGGHLGASASTIADRREAVIGRAHDQRAGSA